MDLGVGQLVDELEQRGDRLPFEIGAFVALEACEGLLQQAVKLGANDVRVTAEGSVVVAASAERAEPDEAARSLVSVLSRLLVAAGPGVPPHLLQLVRESMTGEAQRDLRHLHDAIEASLIPLNRGASRRVLARLVRESDRPPAPEEVAIDPQELDAELDELLRDPASRSLDPEPGSTPLTVDEEPVTAKITVPRAALEAETTAGTETTSKKVAASVTESLGRAEVETGSLVVSEEARVASEPPSLPRGRVGAASAEPVPTSQPHQEAVTATIRVRFPEAEPESAEVPIGEADTSSGHATAGAAAESDPPHLLAPASSAVIESATATTQLWATTPPAQDQRESEAPDGHFEARESSTGREATVPVGRPSVPQPLKQRPSLGLWLLLLGAVIGVSALWTTGVLDRFARSAPSTTSGTAPQTGTIEVTVDPADSQIFIFVGRGPTVAEGLPLAGPHEFVVFDHGLEPSRAVVPTDATWATTDDGASYELAVQAQPLDSVSDPRGLGAPLTTSSPSGEQRGSVRVITNPPGAKVYRFVGMGPTVEIPTASIHEGQEILVYHPEHSARRAVIGPSDWRVAPGQPDHRASLEIALPPLPSTGVSDSPEN
ncbi:MAG: hypothetical protein OEM15_12950 [Myxococcales bacterium]|nr:hypothetical protein [Myxococcales bacterium]MDH3484719.1 hypothetical protein [Myxococcales bacterium]